MVQTVEREQQGDKQEKIERFSVLEGLRQYTPDHVLLVGRPGSGKSTALARLLLEQAEKAKGRQGDDGEVLRTSVIASAAQRNEAISAAFVIPVLVELRYYQKSVLELIQNFFNRHKLFLERVYKFGKNLDLSC